MYPCDGLRVLDMSRVVAGPIAGRILSDLGADVVKLEPPEGDVTRVWGQMRHGLSGFYTQQNAGKRNVCVDLRAPGAVDVVKALARHADVVIENFRAGVLDRLGLGYDALRADNPGLVMLSVSGFGRGGPDSGRPAYAPSVQAETGLLFRQAQFDDAWPTDPMLSIADTYSGLHGTIAVFAALRVRDQTGVGQHIDMAMFDAMIFTDDYAHHAVDAEPVVRLGGDVYDTCNGPVLFAGQLRTIWNALKSQIDDPAPGDVPIADKARLRKQAVQDWALTFDNFDDLAGALDKAGLAFGVVRDQFEVIHSPTAQHRGSIAEIDDNGGTGARRGVVQTPYRFSGADSGVRGAAPHRGQHNAEVLREWAGMDDGTITALAEGGVLQHDEHC
jgi:crotonobetainyl-CoA:carnitine CoA-transferase CaiB-like acyl-CoA transferase